MSTRWRKWLRVRRLPFQTGSFLASLGLTFGLYAAGLADSPRMIWVLTGIMVLNQLVLLFLG